MNTHYDSILGRFAKGATLALGFGTAWAAVSLWLGTTLLRSWESDQTRVVDTFRVSADGTPLIESYPINDYSRQTVRDLEGHETSGMGRGSARALYLAGEPPARPAVLSRLAWTSRILPFINERDPRSIWYFIRDAEPNGAGAFVGYERVSNRVIGRIGLAGRRPGPIPTDERFPVSAETTFGQQWSSRPMSIHSLAAGPSEVVPEDIPPRLVHVPTGNLLRVVDLDDGEVRTAFKAPGPIVAVAVPYQSGYFGQLEADVQDPPWSILVRIPGRVLRLDHAYNVVGTFQIPPETPPGAFLNWYEIRDGSAVVTYHPPMPDADPFAAPKQRVMVYQIAADGAIRKATSVDLSSNSYVTNGRAMLRLMALGIPSPVPLLAVDAVIAATDSNHRFSKALGGILAASLPMLIVVGLVTVILAVVVWRRGGAFGASTRERAAWAAFVALFGPPGWVAYRLHRSWPTRAACPRCGARAPRDRPSCVACGEPFPEPATTGTEIFA